ncbi:MAG: radical SAM protein [Candidatus Colwellbacteria bacterium]|nr:radical SAM protein [Candidatus Colwellbacteria bacterium]
MSDINDAIEIRKSLLKTDDYGRSVETALGVVFPERAFGLEEIRSLWKGYVRDRGNSGGDILSLYIHIPFCSSLCSFCGCRSRVSNPLEISSYIRSMVSHLNIIKDTFNGAVFDTLYIGGGTPSIVEDGDFALLLDTIFSSFTFSGDGQLCSEMNPLTVSLSKLKMLKDHGFTRVSFGAQSFDSEVLDLIGRGYQTEEMVLKAVTEAREAGFKYINLDLVVGLYGDTPEKLISSFKKALVIGPQRIALYPMQPMESYLKSRFGSDAERFDAFWRDLLNRSLPGISEAANEAGFSVPNYSEWNLRMSNTASWAYQDLRIPSEKKEYYPQGSDRTILAIGEGPTSKIDGIIGYQTKIFSADPEKCLFMGSLRNKRREMLNYIIGAFSMKNGISLSEFKDIFDSNLLSEFDLSIERLKELRAVKVEGDYLSLITEDRDERAVHILMFFDDDDVNKVAMENAVVAGFGPSRPSFKSLGLDSPEKMAKWDDLKKEIISATSDKVLNVINGCIHNKEDKLFIIDNLGNEVRINLADGCVLVKEYIKDGINVYEEKASFDDFLKSERSFVFFISESDCSDIVLIKEMIDVI